MNIRELFSRSQPVAEARSIENPAIPVSADSFLRFFGISGGNIPAVTIDNALKVPAVHSAVAFLSRTLAAIPLHAYKRTADGPERLTGKIEIIIHENPNPDMDAFKFRSYFWQQVFTGGRGLAWIERAGPNVEAIWPMDPTKATIKRVNGRIIYGLDGREYPASDVIDIAFMLQHDMLKHYGPIALAEKAIQLALSMNDYASGFFCGWRCPASGACWPIAPGCRGHEARNGRHSPRH